MCGVIGLLRKNVPSSVMEKPSPEEMVELFSKMLINARNRGGDSSGVILVKPKKKKGVYIQDENIRGKAGKIFLHKDYLPSPEYVKGGGFKKIAKEVDYTCTTLIGHTRMGTSGTHLDNNNNHPFMCGRVLGVHNGIISNWKELANKHNIALKSSCDSEIIFALINKFLEEGKSKTIAIKETAKELKGSFACIMVDSQEPHKTILFRKSSPLSLAKYKFHKLVAIASEERHILEAFNSFFNDKKILYRGGNIKEMITIPDKTGLILDSNSSTLEWDDPRPKEIFSL